VQSWQPAPCRQRKPRDPFFRQRAFARPANPQRCGKTSIGAYRSQGCVIARRRPRARGPPPPAHLLLEQGPRPVAAAARVRSATAQPTRPTAAVANAPEVFAGKCLERSSCRGSRGKCSCDNNTPVLSRLYQKTKRVIYRSVMPHTSLDASRHAWRHRLKAPRATSGHCGTTSRLVFALCLSSADARSRYAPGGGGRNTTSCFAESATTSGGFCSFME
jgi:hypothetical protein